MAKKRTVPKKGAMTKYKLTVERTVREDIRIEVKAASLEEAREEAILEAQCRGDDEWSTIDCDYTVDD